MTSLRGLLRKQFLELIVLLPAAVLLEACTKAFGVNVTASVTPTETITPSNIPKPTVTTQPSNTGTSTYTVSPTETQKPSLTRTPVNPAQEVAKRLGYDSCQDCKLIRYQGTNTDSLLVSQGEGILGFNDIRNRDWRSTHGWIGSMLNSNSLYWGRDIFSESVVTRLGDYAYVLKGITDGIAVEERFEIISASGELIATNELSFRIFYLDKQTRLQSILIPLVVKLTDNKMFTMNSMEDIEGEYGKDVTLDEMKDYFKRHFENLPGKIISIGFFVRTEDIDKAVVLAASKGYPIEKGSYEYERRALGKAHIKGRENEYWDLVEIGKTSLEIILFNSESSNFWGGNPIFVELPRVKKHQTTSLCK